MPALTADYFDRWYADGQVSPHGDALQASLGLPPGVVSNSLLSGSGLDEMVRELALTPESLLLDMGCGRGGYTLEIARRTGCRVIGIDHSSVAIGIAAALAAERGLSHRAQFRVADLTATGLADHSVNAIVSIDALTFARPPQAGIRECLRVLQTGGRLVYTSWDPREPFTDDGTPTRPDAASVLREVGVANFLVHDKEDWLPIERAKWEATLAIPVDSDPFLASARQEAADVLEHFHRKRRFLAVVVAS